MSERMAPELDLVASKTSGCSRRRVRSGVVLLVVCAAGIVGCGSLDTKVPAEFDLSGHWVVDELASDPPPDLQAIRLREDRAAIRDRQPPASTSPTFVIQDFPVLAAEALTIEQNRDSMGVRYDETIYRDISWGERKRDFWTVRVGWEEGLLVVQSKRGGIRGVERFALEQDGKRLRVIVQVKSSGEDVDAVRVFRRR